MNERKFLTAFFIGSGAGVAAAFVIAWLAATWWLK